MPSYAVASSRLTVLTPRCHVLAVACLAVFSCMGGTAQPASSQDVAGSPEGLAVFLDCGFCDETFIRQEMRYVDYVRDREVAHVRRQLETNYRAAFNFGLRYRFGSIYNNVVNTRFGRGGSQDQF